LIFEENLLQVLSHFSTVGIFLNQSLFRRTLTF